VLKMSYAPGPSPAISANLFIKCASHPEIAKNSLKTPILGVQDHSKSSTLTPIKSWSLLLVMISSVLDLCLSASVFTLHEITAVK